MEIDWTVVSKKSRGIKSNQDGDCNQGPPKFSSLNNIYSPGKRLNSSEGGGRKPQNFNNTQEKSFHRAYDKPSYSTESSNRGGYKPSYSTESSNRGGYNKSFGKPNKSRDTRPLVLFLSDEEKEKFENLQKEIPHLMMPDRIRKIQKSINIDGLADKMLSDEWVEYQRQGWAYEKVIKPDDPNPIPDGDDYDILPLENKWGDIILFKRVDSL